MKSITIPNFLCLNDGRSELGQKGCFTLTQLCASQRTCDWQLVKIRHGRLAGGTTPFIRRYSTN